MAKDQNKHHRQELARLAQLDRYLTHQRRKEEQTSWENQGRKFWRDPSIEPDPNTSIHHVR